MPKTRNLRRNRNRPLIPSPETPPPESPPPEPSPQPHQTPPDAQFSETRAHEFPEAMQPLEFLFNDKEYTKQYKFQTRCDQDRVVKYLKTLLNGNDLRWFTEHQQFKHLFYMVDEQNRKMMGMWMLLLRTTKTDGKNQIWFVVNGVLIRYSIREHALLSRLYCDYYPNDNEKKGSMDFVTRHFKRTDK